MAEIKPSFLDTLSYAGKFDRQHWRDILTEGIVASGDLAVAEAGTPDMSVNVAAGSAYVQGDQSATQGHYRIYNDAVVNKAIAASDASNDRIDRVVAQVKDSTDISGADDEWELQVLTGTPAGTPSAPALPDDALDLVLVAVGANVTTITNANITDQRKRIGLQNVSEKGWDTAGTFTYNAANKITVASGAALIYQKGDKIRYQNNDSGTWLYDYIITVADTLLTVVGDTVPNATLTDAYYSHIENPLGFPQTFNWTPAYSAGASMTYTSVSTDFAYFSIKGNICRFILAANGTTGGTAGYQLKATLPIDNIDIYSPVSCLVADTNMIGGFGYILNTLIYAMKYDSSNYGLGANRKIGAEGFYKI